MIPLQIRHTETVFGRANYVLTVDSPESVLEWRVGTGDNVEIIRFRTAAPRRGVGTRLLHEMVTVLRPDPPYHTVYGFTRSSNAAGRAFYRKHGFALTEVTGVYADGTAVVFSQPFADLLARFPGDPSCPFRPGFKSKETVVSRNTPT